MAGLVDWIKRLPLGQREEARGIVQRINEAIGDCNAKSFDTREHAEHIAEQAIASKLGLRRKSG